MHLIAILCYIRVCVYNYIMNTNVSIFVIFTECVKYTQVVIFVAIYIGLLVIAVYYLTISYAYLELFVYDI